MLTFSAALIATTLASAPDVNPIIWDRVRAGMSIDELRAVYPEMKATLPRHTFILSEDVREFAGCPATATAHFQRGILTKVVLTGRSEILRKCLNAVRQELSAKFGKPKKLGVLREWTSERISFRLNPYTELTEHPAEGLPKHQGNLTLFCAY
jgi:hypothetical protein